MRRRRAEDLLAYRVDQLEKMIAERPTRPELTRDYVSREEEDRFHERHRNDLGVWFVGLALMSNLGLGIATLILTHAH
ncbi:MAG TPA: hypothetical protein VG348_15770 [Acidimicrobiia bacterium]|jgi:hypothetical protein|nr:hypothetical protein [Acidimicrobiia bacterium]